MHTRVVLVDDHKLFRHALRSMLEKQAGIVVVGEAGDGMEMLKLMVDIEVDVVCMDIGMPNMYGIEATKRLMAIKPEISLS